MKTFLKEQLVSLALLLSIGMVGIALSRYNDASEAIARMESAFKRAQTQDRLIGEPPPGVRRGLRLFKRTVVESTTREHVLAAVGPLLPNTKLLLDRNGIAILVDSRASGQRCGWSFDAQVGAVEGINDPSAIRVVTSGTS